MAMPDAHVNPARVFETGDVHATEDLGASLAASFVPGTVVALEGELGAGKTCFVRGVARGLEVSDDVASPTYTLMHAYEGRLPVWHFDAWMDGRGEAFLEDGGAEFFHGDGVSLVEWASRVESWLPRPRLRVELRPLSAERRLVLVSLVPAPEDAPGSQLQLSRTLEASLAALRPPRGVHERQDEPGAGR